MQLIKSGLTSSFNPREQEAHIVLRKKSRYPRKRATRGSRED